MAKVSKKKLPPSEEELKKAVEAEETAGEVEAVGKQDEEAEPLVSAKDIPKPITMVDAAPKGNVGDIRVFLAGERVGGPSLEEIEKINSNAETDMRTPLMTVILGILQHKGGAMTLEDLAAEVARYWNRPFPTSPYTPEEFIFVMVRNSDHIRFTL
jgi:hypothetical protein